VIRLVGWLRHVFLSLLTCTDMQSSLMQWL